MDIIKTKKFKIAAVIGAVLVLSVIAYIIGSLTGKKSEQKQETTTLEQTTKQRVTEVSTKSRERVSTSSTVAEVTRAVTTFTTTTTELTTETTTLSYNGPHVMSPFEHIPNEFATDTFSYKGAKIKIGCDISEVIDAYGYPENAETVEVPVEVPVEEISEVAAETEENSEDVSDIGTFSDVEFEKTGSDDIATTSETLVTGNIYLYDGFTVYKDDSGKVGKIAVTSPDIATPNGIYPIGKEIFEVTDRFGAPSLLDDDYSLYYYLVSDNRYMYFVCPNGVTSEWGVVLR